MDVSILFFACESGEQEVRDKCHVQWQTRGLVTEPEVDEVEACVEVLAERANAEGARRRAKCWAKCCEDQS